MKRSFLAVFTIIAAFAGALEAAPNNSSLPGEYHPEHRDVVVQLNDDQAEILSPDEAQAAGYYLLYVNRCEGGETISSAGFEDSRTNSSTIISRTTTFPAYPGSDASWTLLMSEVRSILTPFGIEITDQDPGATPHTEIIACGQSFLGPSVLGVAPFGCGLVANAIGYAFAEEHFNERQLAETVAHEAGHTWTLNHLYDCADPMTYLDGCGDKSFQDTALSCAGVAQNGAWQVEACSCGGSTQNSYQTLLGYFGPNNNSFPVLSLLQPADNALLGPGFAILGSSSGTNGGEGTEIYIDGVLKLRFAGTTIDSMGPTDIADGPHLLNVTVTDQYGRSDEVERSIVISSACQCESDQYCDGEQCLPFGQVGDTCTDGATCQGGLCAQGGETQQCTASCTPGADQCANGTECLAVGEGGLCWQTEDTSGCGCQSSGSGASFGALLLLLVILSQRKSWFRRA